MAIGRFQLTVGLSCFPWIAARCPSCNSTVFATVVVPPWPSATPRQAWGSQTGGTLADMAPRVKALGTKVLIALQPTQLGIDIGQLSLPLGTVVKPLAHVDLPRRTDYEGEFIVLSPVNPQADAEELY